MEVGSSYGLAIGWFPLLRVGHGKAYTRVEGTVNKAWTAGNATPPTLASSLVASASIRSASSASVRPVSFRLAIHSATHPIARHQLTASRLAASLTPGFNQGGGRWRSLIKIPTR